ncbi:MAG: protein translocase subunit SecD [Deltaproteobacteria bacterium]|nr:protein translocase subunit SecD [Deltaproteobacteria bacterium]
MDKKRNWRAILTWALAIFSVLYSLPSFMDVPSWFPFQKSVRGGLDLAGGLELRYTVDWKRAVEDATVKGAENLRALTVDELAKKNNENIADLPREKYDAYLKRMSIEAKDIDTVVVKFLDDEAWAIFDGLDSDLVDERLGVSASAANERLELSTSAGDKTATVTMPDRVAEVIHQAAVKTTRDNLEKRVGGMGLIDPDVRVTGDSDIAVQIPGVTKAGELEVVRAVLGRTAQLTMRFVDRNATFLGSPEVLAKLDAFKKQNPDAVEMTTANTGYGPVIRSKNKSLLSRFVRTIEVPKDHMVGFNYVEELDNNGAIQDKYFQAMYLFQKVEITGAMLARARMSYDEQNRIVVLLDFNSEGSRLFADATEKNVGEYLAIMLDDDVESAPVIKGKIVGTASISMGAGNLLQATNEARALTQVLNQGAYQAPVYKVHDYEVGPSLGRDSVNAGGLALVLAFILNAAFVAFYYKKAGVIAAVVLAFNTLLTFIILVSFNTAITLPGIAGIVLTIGTAIDGNIIIYERIREEVRAGKTVRAAVDTGFSRAFNPIVDGNLTTAITGFVLMNFTSGPIHNFAVTLLIGIATSVFTSLFVSRLIFNWWLTKKPAELSI